MSTMTNAQVTALAEAIAQAAAAAVLAVLADAAPAQKAPKGNRIVNPAGKPIRVDREGQPLTPAPTGKVIPGTWVDMTPKKGEPYRKRVPSARAKVGTRHVGLGTDKPNARALTWEVRETLTGVKFYRVVA